MGQVPAKRRPIALRSIDAAVLHEIGRAALTSGAHAEAAQLLAVAAALTPDQARDHALAGIACLQGAWFASAARLLERAAVLAPDHARTAFAAGTAYQQLGHVVPAEAMFRRAVALDPDHIDARYNLAVILVRNSRFAEAEAIVGARLPAFDDLKLDVEKYYALLLQSFGFARRGQVSSAMLNAMKVGPPSRADMEAVQRRAHDIGRRLAWRDERKSRRIVPCLACGSSAGNRILGPIPVHRSAALFVERDEDLRTVYCADHADSPHFWHLVNSSLAALGRTIVIDSAECASCGVIYQNYPHTEASVDGYHGALSRILLADRHGRAGRLNDRGWLKKKLPMTRYLWWRCGLSPGSRVLDVGCADGIALWYLRLAGADAHGIEPSEHAVGFARDVLELDQVVCGAYAPETYPAESFDCIYSHHVLEHAARPLKILRAVERHLKPGGQFLLQVPRGTRQPDGNYEGIGHGHLFAFTPDYLVRTLRAVGFEISEVLTYDSLDELAADRRDATGTLAIWGDYPGSVSILAIKPGQLRTN